MLAWLSVAPLGKPVVPLVYWMLIASSNCVSGSSTPSAPGGQRVPLVRAEEGDLLEVGQLAADLLDHRDVVGALERGRRDQRPAAGLADRVGQLGGAVGGVEVDEHDPRLGGRVLDQDPLGAVRAPDARAGRPAASPEREQPAGEAVDRRAELGVGVAQALVAGDQRLAVRVALDRLVEVRADRLAQQRRRRGAVDVGGAAFPPRPPAAGAGSTGGIAVCGVERSAVPAEQHAGTAAGGAAGLVAGLEQPVGERHGAVAGADHPDALAVVGRVVAEVLRAREEERPLAALAAADEHAQHVRRRVVGEPHRAVALLAQRADGGRALAALGGGERGLRFFASSWPSPCPRWSWAWRSRPARPPARRSPRRPPAAPAAARRRRCPAARRWPAGRGSASTRGGRPSGEEAGGAPGRRSQRRSWRTSRASSTDAPFLTRRCARLRP